MDIMQEADVFVRARVHFANTDGEVYQVKLCDEAEIITEVKEVLLPDVSPASLLGMTCFVPGKKVANAENQVKVLISDCDPDANFVADFVPMDIATRAEAEEILFAVKPACVYELTMGDVAEIIRNHTGQEPGNELVDRVACALSDRESIWDRMEEVVTNELDEAMEEAVPQA